MKQILLATFLAFVTVEVESSEWLFTTPYHAQEFRYSFDIESNMYSFSVADVTERVESCESEEFEVCIISSDLDLVIPRIPPKVGDRWVVHGTQFEYVRRLPELSFWGTTQKDVMVLRVTRDQNYYLYINEIVRSTLLYTREGGLLFSEEDRSNVPRIATTLPSIGARPRE